jgi:cytochrome c-type biogenesis protein CcmH
MIDFWIAAALLVLLALAFLLWPLLRLRKVQAEEDRTALNVALYQERLGELQRQRDAGVLSAEQFEAGRAEAARELIDDTQAAPAATPRAPLGRGLPLVLAVLLPLLGLGLYLHWGASCTLSLAPQCR